MKRNLYRCTCGARLQVKQLVKNDVIVCPKCNAPLPKKEVLHCYHRRKEKLKNFTLICSCGRKSKFPFPTVAVRYECPHCGKRLFEMQAMNINGVKLPRFIKN